MIPMVLMKRFSMDKAWARETMVKEMWLKSQEHFQFLQRCGVPFDLSEEGHVKGLQNSQLKASLTHYMRQQTIPSCYHALREQAIKKQNQDYRICEFY